MALPDYPVHSYHMFTTNRDFVIESIQRCVKPYGYFPVPPGAEIPPHLPRHRFYISSVHKGWISITDNEYFARWELARRSSDYIPGRVVVCWADPGEGWGYQFWDKGSLEAELVTDLLDLHKEWFEEDPTDEELRRFDGNRDRMKDSFGNLGFSLREMQEVYDEWGPERSMEALKFFGDQIGLEDATVNFPDIDSLPMEERLGVRGYHHIDFFQKYKVDVEDPREVVFPEDLQQA